MQARITCHVERRVFSAARRRPSRTPASGICGFHGTQDLRSVSGLVRLQEHPRLGQGRKDSLGSTKKQTCRLTSNNGRQ